jgi:hypothetical protein
MFFETVDHDVPKAHRVYVHNNGCIYNGDSERAAMDAFSAAVQDIQNGAYPDETVERFSGETLQEVYPHILSDADLAECIAVMRNFGTVLTEAEARRVIGVKLAERIAREGFNDTTRSFLHDRAAAASSLLNPKS